MIETFRVRRVEGIVSTDDIIPARYKHMYTDPLQLAPHVFESFLPGLAAKFEPGDVLVNDSIFGIGSSREQAVSAMMASGVSMILAPRFGRILFRNCWNLALPAIEVETNNMRDDDIIRIDLRGGTVEGQSGWHVDFEPPTPFLLELLEAGGLLTRVEQQQAGMR